MNSKSVYTSLIKILDKYKAQLTEMSEEQFQKNPEEGVWSASEVYHHIFDSSLLSLVPIREILNGNGNDGNATLAGKAILYSGALPPGIRFKVPPKLEGRAKKINKKEALEMVEAFEKGFHEVYPLIATANNKLTMQHPRLGFFNAAQWFRFTEIHLNHHLKQLERINEISGYSRI